MHLQPIVYCLVSITNVGVSIPRGAGVGGVTDFPITWSLWLVVTVVIWLEAWSVMIVLGTCSQHSNLGPSMDACVWSARVKAHPLCQCTWVARGLWFVSWKRFFLQNGQDYWNLSSLADATQITFGCLKVNPPPLCSYKQWGWQGFRIVDCMTSLSLELY